MKKLLIAGANGFLARYMTRYFHEKGWRVTGLARRTEGLDEHCRYIHWDGETLGDWAAELDDCDVLINMTAPDPICNAEVMRRFRKLAGISFGLPAAKWMAEIGAFFLRTETELILKSRWVVPTRLLENGFVFKYPEMKPWQW